jgi:hypothetical protein
LFMGSPLRKNASLFQECADMTNKTIVTALTLGFLAFILSVLPVTTAEAECKIFYDACDPGWSEKSRRQSTATDPTGLLTRHYNVTCCRTPSEPYATGETKIERQQREARECEAKGWRYDEQAARCNRPINNALGKSKTTGGTVSSPEERAALKAACQHQNWIWNEQTAHCKKPSQAKADCESRGTNYRYDLDTGGCIKMIARAKPEQAEEQSSSGQASDENDDDHHKHKKHHHHHDDDDHN